MGILAVELRSDNEAGFEPLLSAEEAAAHLRIHAKTLQKMARAARFPAYG